MKYVIDKFKLIAGALCSVIFAGLAVLFAIWRFWILALIFAFFCAVYGVIALRSGAILRVDERGVSRRGLSVSWEEIREVGVAGTRVLNGAKKKRVGARYIYFSTQPMSEDERFEMCLTWPPKDMLYLRFSYPRIKAVQELWARDVVTYNSGNLHF